MGLDNDVNFGRLKGDIEKRIKTVFRILKNDTYRGFLDNLLGESLERVKNERTTESYEELVALGLKYAMDGYYQFGRKKPS